MHCGILIRRFVLRYPTALKKKEKTRGTLAERVSAEENFLMTEIKCQSWRLLK